MVNLTKAELELVLQNLKREFFNLSGQPIENRVLEQSRFGKKFTPSCKLNVKKEPNKFDIPL